jgi:succinylglutamate desuccinylase
MICLGLLSPLGATAGTLIETEGYSGINGPAYELIQKELQSLKSEFPDLVRVEGYGKTVKGRELNVIKIGQLTPLGARPLRGKAVVISGSTHGDEYLNLEDRLPRRFLQAYASGELSSLRRFIDEGGLIYIVPILNPDGYMARERENARGADLNRDFSIKAAGYKAFKQPESTALALYLERESAQENVQIQMTLDYHCCIGALLYPWSFAKPPVAPIPERDRQLHEAIGHAMLGIFGGKYKFGQTPVVLGYSAIGTTKDYYYEKYGSTSFTFEGRYGVEDKNFEKHVRLWDEVFKQLNTRPVRLF